MIGRKNVDVKKLAYATLAGFAVMFILSGIWYNALMGKYYDEAMKGVYKASTILEEPNMVFITLGILIYAFIMAYMFPIGYKGGSAVSEGLKFGAIIGVLITVPMTFIHMGLMSVSAGPALVDAIYQIVEKAIGGIVIAKVYGVGAAAASASESSEE